MRLEDIALALLFALVVVAILGGGITLFVRSQKRKARIDVAVAIARDYLNREFDMGNAQFIVSQSRIEDDTVVLKVESNGAFYAVYVTGTNLRMTSWRQRRR